MQNKDLKKRILDISYKLKLSHLGSCLTAIDIIDEIYKIKQSDEKFILSAGHAHLAHLVVMSKYCLKELESKYKYKHETLGEKYLNEIIEGLIKDYGIHCDRQAGCDVSTGSLGHGIGIAVGMALADRNKNIYCLISDGELAEGSVWEALRIAEAEKLTDLYVYLNNNSWGAYQSTTRYKGIFKFAPRSIKCKKVKTNMNDYPTWLQGQAAHYVVMNEQQYQEALNAIN